MTKNSCTDKATATEIREKRVQSALEGAPESVQNCLKLAFSGSGGKTNAIKAMCLSCTGYDRAVIRDCSGYSCPLWEYRPFQAKATGA